MAISKSSHEFGIRNLLLTSFEQLRSFIYGTATLLPQKCNHDLFPCYLSAKAPGGHLCHFKDSWGPENALMRSAIVF